ncbi:hypothetical protein [Pseudomonas putida]|uniref:hypothetical protein n=1 Tax=Pseudomonas putida TaxID=303 RepID=UPI003D97AC2B
MKVEVNSVASRGSLALDDKTSMLSSTLSTAKNTDLNISFPAVSLLKKVESANIGVVSLKAGQLLDKDSGGALYTRDARFVEYEGDVYRVKNPFYSNYVAAEEVVMGCLFRMTGLDAPAMLLCNGCEDFFSFSKKTRADFKDDSNLSDFACVASRLEPSYKDLGGFLLDAKVMEQLIRKSEVHASASHVAERLAGYQDVVKTYQDADSRLSDIYKKYPDNSHRNFAKVLVEVKKENLIKFNALEALNKYLPEDLFVEQQKHFFVSRLINNWDYLNFSFCNFGYFLPDGNDDLQFRGMTVDFGGSGTLGFGGYSKGESFERATKGARPENPLESTSLFERKDSTFSSDFPKSLSGISTIPRSRPLLSTIKDFIRLETEVYEARNFNSYNKNLEPALEVAYRLSVLPEAAIERYLSESWVMGSDEFPYRDKDVQNNVDVKKIVSVIKDRKNSFIEYFSADVVSRWEERNPLQAARVRGEVEKSLESVIKAKYLVAPLSVQGLTV